jgi:hypothetical protein
MEGLIERKERKVFRKERKGKIALRYFAIPSLRPLRLSTR